MNELNKLGVTTCAACKLGLLPADGVMFGKDVVCLDCKDAYAQALREGGAAVGVESMRLEAIREQHIKHEASIKSVGMLYILGGVVGFFVGGMSLYEALAGISMVAMGTDGAILVIFLMTAVSIAAGIGLRKLHVFGRIVGTIASIFGLFAIGIGTVFSMYILYLLNSAKGRMVFSVEYKQAIAATPHLKCKTSKAAWIALILAVLGGMAVWLLIG